jgi:hypothetical protein
VSEKQPGHSAPIVMKIVKNPNYERGMTQEEIQRFLDAPVQPVGPLRGKRATEEDLDVEA